MKTADFSAVFSILCGLQGALGGRVADRTFFVKMTRLLLFSFTEKRIEHEESIPELAEKICYRRC